MSDLSCCHFIRDTIGFDLGLCIGYEQLSIVGDIRFNDF